MTQQVMIDVSKMVGGEAYPDFIRAYYVTHLPVFKKMMETFGNIEVLSDDLMKEMNVAIKNYVNGHKAKLNPNLDLVEQVSKLPDSIFQPEKIMALALQRIDTPTKCRELVQETIAYYSEEMVIHSKKDIENEGVIVNTKPPIRVCRQVDIKTLFPELTGEQSDYILHVASQTFIADAGGATLVQIASYNGVTLTNSMNPKDVNLYVQIKDGRVKLISSRNYARQGFDTKRDITPVGAITSSIIVDITNLRGDKFEFCRASGEVQMHVVYHSVSGDNSDILDTLKATIPLAAIMENAGQFSSLIQEAREVGGGLQSQRFTLSSDIKASLEELSKRMTATGGSVEEVTNAITERVPVELRSELSAGGVV